MHASNRLRTAHLTLWGTYAATIGSDGRITESSATGGAHNDGFDTAMLTAMMALDSTDQLSMVAAGLPSESVRLRVEIAARDSGAKRGIGFLRYPSSLLQTGMSDQVQAAFVVDTDGHAEPGSIQLVNATRREFAQSVLDAMPRFRYKPLEVSGCAVRSIAEESFQFDVRK